MNDEPNKKYCTGLILSGGGARGFAHLGVLQAIDEKGIRISKLSGVSSGAIAASFYASGYKPFQILEILTDKNFLRYFQISFPSKGLVKNFALFRLMRRMLPENIEDLNIPTCITVTNLTKGKAEYFEKGPLSRIVLASTSIPVLFHPVIYKNMLYADGGIMDNLPIEPLIHDCRFIIASHVNPVKEANHLNSIIKIIERCLILAINENTTKKSQLCNIMIEPQEAADFKIFDFKKATRLFDIGYKAATKILSNLQHEKLLYEKN
jgi:NTE family protein